MPLTLRQYGKKTRKPRAKPAFENPPENLGKESFAKAIPLQDGDVNRLAEKLVAVSLDDSKPTAPKSPRKLEKFVTREQPGRKPTIHKPTSTPLSDEVTLREHTGAEMTVTESLHLPASRRQKGLRYKTQASSPERSRREEKLKTHQSNKPPEYCASESVSEMHTNNKACKTKSKSGKSGSKSRNGKPQLCPRDSRSESAPEKIAATTTNDLVQLKWPDVCPTDSTITKIAEASFAEIYRIINPLGISIIKVIRLASPIKPQTKAQVKAGLVDEEPHDPNSACSELRISQWLASIPGFVVYKEQFLVGGKATPKLVATHQAFHRKLKRQDPDRLQFYPSPSRYLDDTTFLVIELGDAGVGLEDFNLAHVDMVWDIFLLLAVALARAEELAGFEHRDLHEGNLCVRRVRDPVPTHQRPGDSERDRRRFGFSGLDITILDYGLSRADDPDAPLPDDTAEEEALMLQRQHGGSSRSPDSGLPTQSSSISSSSSSSSLSQVAYADLETDLSLFTSTHAPQCAVYRRMRSHLLTGDRSNVLSPSPPSPSLPSQSNQPLQYWHKYPYPITRPTGRPLDWSVYAPYTNVLWLAYIYSFLTGEKAKNIPGESSMMMEQFKKETREMWERHLDPDAPWDEGDEGDDARAFTCAGDVVRFAVEMGWVGEEQLVGGYGCGGS